MGVLILTTQVAFDISMGVELLRLRAMSVIKLVFTKQLIDLYPATIPFWFPKLGQIESKNS